MRFPICTSFLLENALASSMNGVDTITKERTRMAHGRFGKQKKVPLLFPTFSLFVSKSHELSMKFLLGLNLVPTSITLLNLVPPSITLLI